MLSITRLVPTKVGVPVTLIAGLLPSIWTLDADAAGFRKMSVEGVEIGVWYPSDVSTIKQRLGPFDVDIANDAAILDGKHEIILFSHGNSGFYRNHYLTAQTLADAGFIVVPPPA